MRCLLANPKYGRYRYSDQEWGKPIRVADEYSYRQEKKLMSQIKKISSPRGKWESNYPAKADGLGFVNHTKTTHGFGFRGSF